MLHNLKNEQSTLEVLRTTRALSNEKKVLDNMLKNGVNPHTIMSIFYNRVKYDKQEFKTSPEYESRKLIENANISDKEYICVYNDVVNDYENSDNSAYFFIWKDNNNLFYIASILEKKISHPYDDYFGQYDDDDDWEKYEYEHTGKQLVDFVDLFEKYPSLFSKIFAFWKWQTISYHIKKSDGYMTPRDMALLTFGLGLHDKKKKNNTHFLSKNSLYDKNLLGEIGSYM
jgi:hypothetical protein